MQIKTTMRYHFTPVRMLLSKRQEISNVVKGVDKREPLYTGGENINLYGYFWASQVALVVKNLPASAGDTGLIPGLGRSPGVGNGNRLQYSYLENPMDRGAWRAAAYGGCIAHNTACGLWRECGTSSKYYK